MPSLHHLSLDMSSGFGRDWSALSFSSLVIHSLTSLELTSLHDDDRSPPFRLLLDILLASPHLQNLRLSDCIEDTIIAFDKLHWVSRNRQGPPSFFDLATYDR